MAFFPLFSDHHFSVLVTVPVLLTEGNELAPCRDLSPAVPKTEGRQEEGVAAGTQIEHT